MASFQRERISDRRSLTPFSVQRFVLSCLNEGDLRGDDRCVGVVDINFADGEKLGQTDAFGLS